jgi:hypothetical protein
MKLFIVLFSSSTEQRIPVAIRRPNSIWVRIGFIQHVFLDIQPCRFYMPSGLDEEANSGSDATCSHWYANSGNHLLRWPRSTQVRPSKPPAQLAARAHTAGDQRDRITSRQYRRCTPPRPPRWIQSAGSVRQFYPFALDLVGRFTRPPRRHNDRHRSSAAAADRIRTCAERTSDDGRAAPARRSRSCS